MKKTIRMLVTFLLTFAFLSVSAFAADNAEITNVLEDYYSTYMDAFLGEGYPDFSPYVQQNENTRLYDVMIRYELDSGRYLGSKVVAYDFDMTTQELQVDGLSAAADVVYRVTIRFEGMEEDDATIRIIPYHFGLVQTDNGWKIAEIESEFFVHTAFIEELSRMRSGDIVESAAEIAEDRLEGFREADLELLRQGDESSTETLRKLQNMNDLQKDVARASRVSFSVSDAIAYADEYALDDNPLFYRTSEDCTHFVSQCAWAGYGGWVEGDTQQTKENIASFYRMYHSSNTSKSWFAGTGGGSDPWENVSQHWNFIVDNEGDGPCADGYNNNSVYTNLAARMIAPGETLQFYNFSKGKYTHSVFVVSKSSSSYSSIYCNAHNAKVYHEPIATFIEAFGGDDCRMRDMDYVSGRF